MSDKNKELTPEELKKAAGGLSVSGDTGTAGDPQRKKRGGPVRDNADDNVDFGNAGDPGTKENPFGTSSV